MIDINKPVSNPDLVDKMHQWLTDRNPETEAAWCRALLKAHFLAPVAIDPDPPAPTSENGKTILRKDTTIRFLIVKNKAGKPFYPAFTDWLALRKGVADPNPQALIVTLKDYASMVLNQKEKSLIDGFVINFFDEGVPVTRENMHYVLSHYVETEKGDSMMIGQPEHIPDGLFEALQNFLPELRSVKSAYFLLAIRNQADKSYLMVVDTDRQSHTTFSKIAQVTTPFLAKGEYIDFVTLDSDLGQHAIKDQKPFYVRKKHLFF